MMSGDAGNDTLVWNNGDGSDRMTAAPATTVEVKATPPSGTVHPRSRAGRCQVPAHQPGAVHARHATERSRSTASAAMTRSPRKRVGAATLLPSRRAGADTINGSEARTDPRRRGQRVLSGGGGDDRIRRPRQRQMKVGGDDTLVWNNGDGSDLMNGDAGSDDVEVNGSPTAGDVFTVGPRPAHQVRPNQPRAVLARLRLERDDARQRPRRRRHGHRRRSRKLLRDRVGRIR